MGGLTVRCGKNIPRRPVLWMWQGRIPKNKVTLIQGDGGEGKSSFALFFGAGMSVGKAPPELINGMMMDSEITDPINVFYVSTEDESEDTALPRFLRFGGNEERYYDNDEKENHFEMTEECLEEVYKACHPGIIIIDPYQSFLPDGVHLGKCRIIGWWYGEVNFCQPWAANFAGLLEVSQGICRLRMAEIRPPDRRLYCAVFP